MSSMTEALRLAAEAGITAKVIPKPTPGTEPGLSSTEAFCGPLDTKAILDFDAIPPALKSRPQWLLWSLEERGGKHTKIPRHATPNGLRNAKSTDPKTWRDFETIRADFEQWKGHGISGIGFVFTDSDPFVGIDVDDVRDPDTGEWERGRLEEAESFGSYAELSQSGKGVHVIVEGEKPGSKCRRGAVEIYQSGRFFVMTGNRIEGTPDDVKTAAPGSLEAFYRQIEPESAPITTPTKKNPQKASKVVLSDSEVIRRAREAKNGAKFASLFDHGDTSGHEGDDSRADAALCSILAYQTRDPGQIDRIFRKSALWRDKWDEKHGSGTYGDITIDFALSQNPPSPSLSRAVPAPVVVEGAAPIDDDDFARYVYPVGKDRYRIDDSAVAGFIYEHHHTVSFGDELYIYIDGVYVRDDGTISAEVKRFVDGCRTREPITKVLREVRQHLLATNPYPRMPFNLEPNLIPVANGVLRIDYDTGAVEHLPHSPAYRFTYKLPVDYDPKASGDLAYQLLAQYVSEDDLPLLVQPFAQALLQMQIGVSYKKNYLLQGMKNGGKSTFTHIIGGFFGPDVIAGVSLQEITADRFSTARLENKLVNYFDDLGDVPLQYTGKFKALTGGCDHDVEDKFTKKRRGRITCPHIFTCNLPPKVSEDADDAFWERWEYVRFPFTFEVDPTFEARTLTPAFYSSLLAVVIKAMITIRQSGKLVVNHTSQEVREKWTVLSDPLARFLDEKMDRQRLAMHDFDPGKLFRAYLEWCDKNDVPMRQRLTTLTKFTQSIPDHGLVYIDSSTTLDGVKKPYRVYRGQWEWRGPEDMGFDFGPQKW